MRQMGFAAFNTLLAADIKAVLDPAATVRFCRGEVFIINRGEVWPTDWPTADTVDMLVVYKKGGVVRIATSTHMAEAERSHLMAACEVGLQHICEDDFKAYRCNGQTVGTGMLHMYDSANKEYWAPTHDMRSIGLAFDPDDVLYVGGVTADNVPVTRDFLQAA